MKQSPKKKTSISIFLVLFLLLLYHTLLNISPANLIEDTTFWFLLSNSIIFIVAIDYGVFSTPDDTEIYDELIRHNRSYNRPPCLMIENTKSRENVKEEKKSLNCSNIAIESVKNEKEEKSFLAEKPEAPMSSSGEEENEYSKLSDEELNRRVEEFIRKFKRELSSKR